MVFRGDDELIASTCDGESEAFGELVLRYQDYVYNAVVHLVGAGQDAEDIAQDVFLKAFRNLQGFRRQARFSTWLYGIMLNSVRTYWRRNKRSADNLSLDERNKDGNPVLDPAFPGGGLLDMSVRAETADLVRRIIGELSEDLREVIVLRDIEGLSYEELSVVLDVPLGTVKSRLSRARSSLKDKIAPRLGADLISAE